MHKKHIWMSIFFLLIPAVSFFSGLQSVQMKQIRTVFAAPTPTPTPFPHPCAPTGSSPTFSLDDHCTFGDLVDGVDAGTEAVNTALLKVDGKTLTMQNTQTLAVGTMKIENNGKVIIPDGGIIKIGQPIWVDAPRDWDGDNVPSTTGGGNKTISGSQPSLKTRWNAYEEPAFLDCFDSGVPSQSYSALVWYPATAYKDSDVDTFTAGKSTYNCFNNETVDSATYASVGATTPIAIPAGSVRAAAKLAGGQNDCNETGANANTVWYQYDTGCYKDGDGDGYGGSTKYTCLGEGDYLANPTCAQADTGSVGTGDAIGSMYGWVTNDDDCNDFYADYNLVITGSNPIAHLKFEEGGWWIKDTVGNASAAMVNNALYDTGKFGQAARFINSNEYAAIQNPISINGTQTIEAWFNYPLIDNGSWNTLTRGWAAAGDADHQIIVRRSDLHLGAYDNHGGTGFKDTGYVMSNVSNGWHHLAAVANGSTTTYYIDGAQVGNAIAWVSTGTIYAIGNYQGGGQQWGYVDDMRIYNYARSTSQLAEDIANKSYSFTQYANDTDNDGYGTGGSTSTCVPLAGYGANSGDCNQSASVAEYVNYTHNACYMDFDLDGYTIGTTPNSTCLSGASCNYSRYGSNGTGSVIGYNTGQIKDSANGWDCRDDDANAKPGQTNYYTTTFATPTGTPFPAYDWNCDKAQTKQITATSNCSNCVAGYDAGPPACGAVGSWDPCGMCQARYKGTYCCGKTNYNVTEACR